MEDNFNNIVLLDAHCHPTERPQRLDLISSMKASKLVLMSTNLEDIDLVDSTASLYPEKVIPAFGYHPWYSHRLYIGSEPSSKQEHYQKVLNPVPPKEFIDMLPAPHSLDSHLQKIRSLLIKHPHALVGEIGLDKSFRLPETNQIDDPSAETPKKKLSQYRVDLEHQTAIFESILEIAAELQRSVSVHGVNCHNAVYSSIVKRLGRPENTSNICLHSYSGSAEFLASTWLKSKALKTRVFVSCSTLVNINTKERADKLLSQVPPANVLSESDYFQAGDTMDSYILASLNRICDHYGWKLEDGSKNIEENFHRFINYEGQ
ncbi:hypothetical protein AWJ20_2964 [Sugiyamaella lignohabitans]|uniref:Uncharacterized protein n=1 Tax=Sugiyamaella lignohabitans TaxID=796027 RepID=A0A161HMX0_9ASCO|nr:uncharacterized protein AWJ20_2964 [Sugiyamaella lignohabitans]ANB15337.1 hypothetical protein AWJ20_2964 [Sugiyamaella lignohabitans]